MTSARIPVSRPLLPTAQHLHPYLQLIDHSRWYTNHGILHGKLTERLAQHWGVLPTQLMLASSGTSALIGAILSTVGYSDDRDRLCFCPSYTFVATAAAALACGYKPYFGDVDFETWMLDPSQLEKHPHIRNCALLIVVAPYGRWPDLAGWADFRERTGVPVIIDAAACFDSLDAMAICGRSIPVAISLHATKTFSTAEGGLVICGDEAVAAGVGRALNFGFSGNRLSLGPCTNGKLSEYHAAIGLAELDHWSDKQSGFLDAAKGYLRQASRMGLEGSLHVNTSQALPYVLYQAPCRHAAARTCSALEEAGIGYRRWYGDGVHRLPFFSGSPSDPLSGTEHLAECLLGLPMFVDLDQESIEAIITALSLSYGHHHPDSSDTEASASCTRVRANQNTPNSLYKQE